MSTVPTCVRLTPTLHEQAVARAAEMGLKLSEYLRWLLVNDLEKRRTP